jgi:phospholipid/cholesterol/gamma-HCH transport system permease protein
MRLAELKGPSQPSGAASYEVAFCSRPKNVTIAPVFWQLATSMTYQVLISYQIVRFASNLMVAVVWRDACLTYGWSSGQTDLAHASSSNEKQPMTNYLDLIGQLGLFASRGVHRGFRRPFEFAQIWRNMESAGWQSLPLVAASGFALGVILTLHTRSSLIEFGAEALIPAVQSLAFFSEIGPLITGLLVAGRVGAGIGAEIANMRATEQIDAVEALSIDSFKLLVIPRIIACMIVLPVLTVFTDVCGLIGGFLVECQVSHLSLTLFLNRAFSNLTWASVIPPTLKTTMFGFVIGLVSGYYGYTIDEGSIGVGRASTNSVVVSSLLIILIDVVLVKFIFFLFPNTAV